MIASVSTVIAQPQAMQPYFAASTVLIVTLQTALFWLLIGFWARWSLRVKLEQSVDSALAAIQNNWLNGAAIAAGAPILLRRLIVDLNLYPLGRPTVTDDFLTALIAFPTLMGGAFVLSLISRRALARRA